MAFGDLLSGALVVFLATSLGAAVVLLFGRHKTTLGRTVYSRLMAFCAGVMAFSAMEMFRESQAHAGGAIACGSMLVGIFLLLLFERMLPHVHFALKRKRMSYSGKKAALIVGAVAIHNLPEGFAIASAFAHSVSLGWLVALSIAVQDAPEGLLIAAPLLYYGLSRLRSFQFGMLSGFVEAVAAVVSYALLNSLAPMVPLALGLSAGAMVCVVAKELLPDAVRSGPRSAALFFLLGILAAFGIASVLGF